MSEPFIGEIRMFAGNFAPRNWARCDGQVIPIQQNTALFSLLGTNYGGNGTSTFGLPDLRNRMPMHQGQGPGLSPRNLGAAVGTPSVSLSQTQMPAHTHAMQASSSATPSTGTPGAGVALAPTAGARIYRAPGVTTVTGAPTTSTGGGQAHQNRQPYLGIMFIISLFGVFPGRN